MGFYHEASFAEHVITLAEADESAGKITDLERALNAGVRGQVSFDVTTRGLHATDASQYQVMPRCVVWPLDWKDAVAAVRIAGTHGVAITPRGGATSLSGQTMWSGMVLDMSRHMDHVLEVNAPQRWARVQPGVIRDHLNAQVAGLGLHFAPDPATGDRATVGGMIGNNSSGTHSVVFGKTSDHVIEVTVALADGTVLTLGPKDAAQWDAAEAVKDRGGAICREFRRIIEANRSEIEARYPKVMRRVSGYNLDAFTADPDEKPWNLATLIVGSEGTLGVLLEAKVRLTPLPRATALCAVHFDDLAEALRAVPGILEHRPAAVELLDALICEEAKRNRAVAELSGFIEGRPAAILIVEFFGDSEKEASDKAYRLAAVLEQAGIGCAWPVRTQRGEQLALAGTLLLQGQALRLLGQGTLPCAQRGQRLAGLAALPFEPLAGLGPLLQPRHRRLPLLA